MYLNNEIMNTSNPVKNTVIKVIDGLPGRGKTSKVLEQIAARDLSNTQWLYITLLRDEVNRVHSTLKHKHFVKPYDDSFQKTREVLNDWVKGHNIVATHSVYKLFSRISQSDNMPYTPILNKILIIDEAIEPIERINIAHYVIEDMLAGNTIYVNEDNRVYWSDKISLRMIGDKDSSYRMLYRMLVEDKAEIYLQYNTLLWVLNVDAFRAFDVVFILTFGFKDSLMCKYLEAKGFTIEYSNLRLMKTEEEALNEIKNNITFGDTSDIEELGFTFTFNNWNNEIRHKTSQLKNVLHSLLKDIPMSKVLFTSPKKYASDVIPFSLKELSDSVLETYTEKLHYFWLFSKVKATNKYAHKDTVVYLYDKYLDSAITTFAKDKYGMDIDSYTNNAYAVTELIQFVFRSAIRNGEPITLYLPSKRMRNLLKHYLGLPVEEDYKSYSSSKLTINQREELMADYNSGVKQKDLVKKYGLSRSQVHRIIKANK